MYNQSHFIGAQRLRHASWKLKNALSALAKHWRRVGCISNNIDLHAVHGRKTIYGISNIYTHF